MTKPSTPNEGDWSYWFHDNPSGVKSRKHVKWTKTQMNRARRRYSKKVTEEEKKDVGA